MTWMWIAFALGLQQPAPTTIPFSAQPQPLRVYTSPTLHVGVRPHFDYSNGFGVTVQVSTMLL